MSVSQRLFRAGHPDKDNETLETPANMGAVARQAILEIDCPIGLQNLNWPSINRGAYKWADENRSLKAVVGDIFRAYGLHLSPMTLPFLNKKSQPNRHRADTVDDLSS